MPHDLVGSTNDSQKRELTSSLRNGDIENSPHSEKGERGGIEKLLSYLLTILSTRLFSLKLRQFGH